MPRVARGLADNQVYHILNRGNGRQEVFHKPEDFAAFVRLIAEAKRKYPIQIIAYCLMTNHFHLLVKAGEGSDLGQMDAVVDDQSCQALSPALRQ